MLRLFALLLLIANGLFFAWSKGYLSQFGFNVTSKNETFRLTEQIEPERIAIIQKDAALASSTANNLQAPAPTQAPGVTTTCLTAGTFNEKQSTVLKQTLSTKFPDLIWRFATMDAPARWIVYMGKYPNNAARDLKKQQLNKIKVRYEMLADDNLEPGLSLGSHATQAAATQSLQQLFKRGVRTARVLQESPEQKAQTLIVPAINDATRAKLNTVYATLTTQLASKALQVCK